MTLKVSSVEPAPSAESTAAPGRDGRPWWKTALAVAGAAVMGGAAWWWSHPSVFPEVGSEVHGPAETGDTVYVGIAEVPETSELHLIDATPRLVFGEDVADVSVLVCRRANEFSGIGYVFGEDAAESCASLDAPVDTTLSSDDQLVLQVHTEFSGVVAFDGIDVTYSTGWQRGTQATGLETAVVITEPAVTPGTRP